MFMFLGFPENLETDFLTGIIFPVSAFMSQLSVSPMASFFAAVFPGFEDGSG